MQVLSHCVSFQLDCLLQSPPSLWSQCRWPSCWSRLHRGCTLCGACPPSSRWCSGTRLLVLLLRLRLRWVSWADNTTTFGASGYNDSLCSWYGFSIRWTCSRLSRGSCGSGSSTVTSSSYPGLIRRVERYWPGSSHRFTSCRRVAGFTSFSWS